MLPGPVERWISSYEDESWGATKAHHFDSGGGVVTPRRGVSYNDFPRRLTDAEVDVELAVAEQLQGILSREELITEDGQPAVDVLTWRWPLFIMARYVLHLDEDGSRLYALTIGSPQDPRKHPEAVKRFQDSFHVATD